MPNGNALIQVVNVLSFCNKSFLHDIARTRVRVGMLATLRDLFVVMTYDSKKLNMVGVNTLFCNTLNALLHLHDVC